MLIALTVIASTPPVTDTDHYLAGELNRHIARANDCLERVRAAVAGVHVLNDANAERLGDAARLLRHARFVLGRTGAAGDLHEQIGEWLDGE